MSELCFPVPPHLNAKQHEGIPSKETKIKTKLLAAIGVAIAITIPVSSPPAAAAPQNFHPRRTFHPAPPGKKPEAWRPHLQFAYEALISASQAMQTSSTPDVSDDLKYLRTAYLELKRLPSIFKGHRADAMNDIVRASNHLKRTPPSRGAVGFTEDAIANVQACMQMYPS